MRYKTGNNEKILEFLKHSAERSYSLIEICEAIADDGRGKSTVYRIVSELVSSGLVRKLSDDKTRHCTYQYIGDAECKSHLHLKCRSCGKLIHLDGRLSEILCRELSLAHGFSPDAGSIIFGRCNACAGKEGNANA